MLGGCQKLGEDGGVYFPPPLPFPRQRSGCGRPAGIPRGLSRGWGARGGGGGPEGQQPLPGRSGGGGNEDAGGRCPQPRCARGAVGRPLANGSPPRARAGPLDGRYQGRARGRRGWGRRRAEPAALKEAGGRRAGRPLLSQARAGAHPSVRCKKQSGGDGCLVATAPKSRDYGFVNRWTASQKEVFCRVLG